MARGYRTLDSDAVIATCERLRFRVEERFPGSSLYKVADELLTVARASAATSAAIHKPDWRLRLATWTAVAALLGAVPAVLVFLHRDEALTHLGSFIQISEAGLNLLMLIGAAVFFLVTVEHRVKRRKALRALHELRSLAHIIDMHQLTKDPERLFVQGENTKSSPERKMSPFELSRYLDYCSEMLSLIGKIAALYAQYFEDEVALTAVDELEDLTTALSRNIWQKIVILGSAPSSR
ncbi:MAG: hypothetical protein HY924_10715 [Elusimicrobia bacterium]|nr:hypothetical protein [Elusimicrobiota bacterium]